MSAAFLAFHASYLAHALSILAWSSRVMHLLQPAHATRLSRSSEGRVDVCHPPGTVPPRGVIRSHHRQSPRAVKVG
jgi:hypothetical protein